MINYFVIKRVNIFTLEYDGLKIYSDDKSKHFSINDLEKIILDKTEINMKLSFKRFILLDILFANSVKELYKYLELEEVNHFDDQRHLQNLKEDLRLL